MRLPTETELSREQREVCNAPPEGNLLVVGPPGTGKTVVAIYRKKMLEGMDETVDAVAWNNVLARYGGLDRTFESWHNSWWQAATGQRFPHYRDNGAPRPDYQQALENALGPARTALETRGNWGHLVLDEAQDFSQVAHKLLAAVRSLCEAVAEDPPSILILADENQRITDSNSTVDQIRKAYSLTGQDLYFLTKNYRNTAEIAKVARNFYVGTASGIPGLPERSGDKPKLLTSCPIDDAVRRIVRHARNHEDQEIGVLVYYDNTRNRLYNKLKHRLGETEIRVQTYHGNTRRGGGPQLARTLEFDRQGIITVLCFASAKGVEFDTVFLPELQQLTGADEGGEISKMQLYVMASRARSQLTFMMDDKERATNVWRLLPGGNELNELFDVD